eukprot:CAMPEP_0119304456 /NCGR_PEP_ID=MMETSP1333-20130426/5680_1 /TAXON_ID=418940 /ORGANISM="Scyphosphaera apsteinii, Strain RCC1455" /LENGTH=40 /DNA_ID= /DNA_START= /DNA_END= /DNA_ORIENTATION=
MDGYLIDWASGNVSWDTLTNLKTVRGGDAMMHTMKGNMGV